jgi:hypothetical protein
MVSYLPLYSYIVRCCRDRPPNLSSCIEVPIALDSIELIFEAIDEEAHADLSESLTRYLSVCGKSTGAQLVAGYLASKNRIELNIWLSDPIVKSMILFGWQMTI